MTVVTAAGLEWLVDPGTDDTLGPEHETTIEGTLLGLIPPGGVFLDIGAHVGHYTLRAAAAGHRVIAVEANPDTAARLALNLGRNRLGGVRIIAAPAWDTVQAARWESYHTGTQAVRNGSGRVLIDADGGLKTVVLDHELAAEPAIDVVKIDTEGSELYVLRGLAETLDRCRPAVWIEDHAWTGMYSRAELFTLLVSLGYDWELAGEWSGLTYYLARHL